MIPAATLQITGAALLIFAAGVLTGSFTTTAFRAHRNPRPPRTQAIAPATPGAPASATAPQPAPAPATLSGSPTNRRAERVLGKPPGWQRLEALRRLEDQIQLTPEQRDRIRGLIRESEQRIRSDWEPVVPRIQAELRELRKRIAAELEPSQRERFEALFERRERPDPTKTSRSSGRPDAVSAPPSNP